MSFVQLNNFMQPPLPGSRRAHHVPVRGGSIQRGRGEAVWFRPFSARERGLLMLAAERFDRSTRQAGRRNGALGHIALELLRELTRLIDFRTGRLEPAYDTLAARMGRSRSAVIEAMKKLKLHGFLDWTRRYEPTGAEFGPQLRQVSNAYRLAMPAFAQRLLGWLASPPPTDDAEGEAIKAQRNAMHLDDSPLGKALKLLGGAVRERESAKQPEIPNLIYNSRQQMPPSAS